MICPVLSHANTYSYTVNETGITTALQQVECIKERCD